MPALIPLWMFITGWAAVLFCLLNAVYVLQTGRSLLAGQVKSVKAAAGTHFLLAVGISSCLLGETRWIITGLSLLLFSVCLWQGATGIVSGCVTVGIGRNSSMIRREDAPVLYWSGVCLWFFVPLVLLAIPVWMNSGLRE